MEITLLVARLLLAIVFVAAGAAKAVDLAGSRRALIDFGLPEKLAVPLGYGLPFLEMLIALALLPGTTAWIAAVVGLGLLLAFAAGISINLSRGRAPDCNCFGQLRSRPVSWSLVARDLALATLAAIIVVEGRGNPGLSPLDWIATLRAGEAAGLALGVVALGMMATNLAYLRRIAGRQSSLLATVDAIKKVVDEDYAEAPVERAEAAGPLHGLPVGAAAPQFSLPSISGEQVGLDDLLAHRKPVLLIFVSPNCVPCESVLQSVETWERDYRKDLTIALLAKGAPNENNERMARYSASHLLLQAGFDVAEEYEAKWTPAAVLIGPNGRMASRVSFGYEQIDELVTRSSHGLEAPALARSQTNESGNEPQIIVGTPQSLVNVGQPVRDFSLQDVDGNLVSSKDLLGRDTLLLFWDPGCPFCRSMEEDIRLWEQNPPRRAPRLVFISSGDLEEVKPYSARFKARTLYDPEFKVGLLFGTNLTPSAVLIDSNGRIVSGTEGGRPNILALGGIRPAAVAAASGI